MPHLNLITAPEGPLVDVWISVSKARRSALEKQQEPVPTPIKARALVDTGATCTAIDGSILRKLGVPPSGTVSVLTASTHDTPHVCNQFDVLVVIPDAKGNALYVGDSTPVIEASLAAQGLDALLGRDILGGAVLIYNGGAGVFTLSF